MKDIRELTGISQQQLADYLDVPRSQVALAETRKRSLSAPALEKTRPMYAALQSNEPAPQIEMDNTVQAQSLRQKLEKRSAECTYLAAKAKLKLADMETAYQQCCHALQMVNALTAELPATGKEAKRDKHCLKIIELETRKKLKTCGLEARTMLQVYIDGLEFEAGKVEGVMK